MSGKFSATLRIGDFNDFIAPSQDCVVSLKGQKTIPSKQEKIKVATASTLSNSESVKISLKDCLACSGCITSAETVMLEKQSLHEFLDNINKGKPVIVSLSPQSRASLSVHFNLSPLQVLKKLTTFFKSLGVRAVYDTSCSRDLCLVEACNEFITRYNDIHLTVDGNKSVLPMLSSACPGWICYAEKTLGSYILPYISSVKSPQQIIGSVIKHHLCQQLGFRPDEVYHVTIMPCFDKKLEAARDDFSFSEEYDGEKKMITEVDSVLTSGEVLELIQLKCVDFSSLEESVPDRLLSNINEKGDLFGVQGGSGGYAQTIFLHAAKVLFKRELCGSLEFKTLRNTDFREATLEVDGKSVLKFALCYGFRNLQNMVRKIKSGVCEYHFVEVMACPSGCLNGGGQVKAKAGQSVKGLIQSLEAAYSENVLVADPYENPVVKKLYAEWLGKEGSLESKRYLHTKYHPLLKNRTSQLHMW